MIPPPAFHLSPAITESPLFGLTLTITAYAIGLQCQKRCAWLNALILACILGMATLWITKIPLEDYRVGGDILTFLLGPATVALAVPLYKNRQQLQAAALPVVTGIVVGSIIGLSSGMIFVMLMKGSEEIMYSMASKSVTTPIAMEVSRFIGGIPELTAALTCVTGVLGAVCGPELLRLCGIYHPAAMGVAMGASTHGMGTARMLQDDPLRGSFSGVAMGLTGILTAILAALFL